MKEKKVVRKVKKSGVVKMKPKITSTRPKERSLIAEHIAEATGKDFFIDCIPDYSANGALDMCLKVRTIERLKQPGLNQIKNSINLGKRLY